MARKIELVDYNPQWAKDFKVESKKIKEILAKNCVGIHHIGSTAVKGMKAVPTIDMMAIVKDMSAAREQLGKLDALGYRYMGEEQNCLYFEKGEEYHTHHLHIYEDKNKNETSRLLAVKAYLQGNPEVVKEYSELKIKLAEEYAYDPEGYSNGKDSYLKELEQVASVWMEKQIVQGNYTSMGMSMGLAIGCGIGSAMGNMTMGMCMGLCIGMAVGSVIGASKVKK